MVLACYFAPSQLASLPVRPFRSTAKSGLHPHSAASTLLARCSSARWVEQLRLLPPLPFGILTSLRIKAFNRICRRSARLPNPPDLRSLPAACFYL